MIYRNNVITKIVVIDLLNCFDHKKILVDLPKYCNNINRTSCLQKYILKKNRICWLTKIFWSQISDLLVGALVLLCIYLSNILSLRYSTFLMYVKLGSFIVNTNVSSLLSQNYDMLTIKETLSSTGTICNHNWYDPVMSTLLYTSI